MFRRRRREADPVAAADQSPSGPEEAAGEAGAAPVGEPGGKPRRAGGPWDSSEVDLDDPAQHKNRIDLGGLLIRGEQGMQLQLQVDEQSGRATSATAVLGDAAVQLLAVAAPRTTPMWPDMRAQIAADASRRGGTATEAEGPFGTELRLLMPVQLSDGRKGMQPSRVIGIEGPRWMLRATFLGRAAVEDEAYARLAAVVRDTVVVRGGHAMPPGDVIALRVPKEAEQQESAEAQRPSLDDLKPGPTITEIR